MRDIERHEVPVVRPGPAAHERPGPHRDRRGRRPGHLDLKQAQWRMRQLATHDYLTGLPNRVMLYERLDQASAATTGSARPCALLYLDLDRFKPINDELGHHVGDAVLVALPTASSRGARHRHARPHRRRRVRRAGRGLRGRRAARAGRGPTDRHHQRADRVEGIAVEVGVSIGIVAADATSTDADSLLARADAAMYAAKSAGVAGSCSPWAARTTSMCATTDDRASVGSCVGRGGGADHLVARLASGSRPAPAHPSGDGCRAGVRVLERLPRLNDEAVSAGARDLMHRAPPVNSGDAALASGDAAPARRRRGHGARRPGASLATGSPARGRRRGRPTAGNERGLPPARGGVRRTLHHLRRTCGREALGHDDRRPRPGFSVEVTDWRWSGRLRCGALPRTPAVVPRSVAATYAIQHPERLHRMALAATIPSHAGVQPAPARAAPHQLDRLDPTQAAGLRASIPRRSAGVA